MSERATHPEALPSEVHIGNIWRADFPFVGWHSKRLGTVAYDTAGHAIPKGQAFAPVFVKRAEIEGAGVPITATPIDHRWRVRAIEKHGWVTPDRNGIKARCGGPGLCSHCRAEWRERYGVDYPATSP